MSNIIKQDKIKTLNLSLRSTNALTNHGIYIVEDLLNYPIGKLSNIINIGEKSSNEIKDCIIKLKELYKEGHLLNTEEYANADLFTFENTTYKNIPIEDLGLSVRTYFYLNVSSIYQLLDIFNNKNDLPNIKNISNQCLEEIENVLSDPNLKYDTGQNKLEIKLGQLVSTLLYYVENNDGINYNQLYNTILSIFKLHYGNGNENDLDMRRWSTDKILLKKIYTSSNIKNIFKLFITEYIKQNKYGCYVDPVIEKMPKYFNNKIFVEYLIKELLSEKIISNHSNILQMNYSPVLVGMQNILDDREYEIFKLRLEGNSLEEVGKKFQVSRERIRQIESISLQKINNNNLVFEEDTYSEVFSKYTINKDDFLIAFQESEQTYNYLRIVYDCGDLDIELLADDETMPYDFRVASERIKRKRYIFIGNTVLNRNNKELIEYVTKTFARNDIAFDDFFNKYQLFLEELSLHEDNKFSIDIRRIRNIIVESRFILWKQWEKFRYYNIDSYDYSNLLDVLDLNQYKDVEYSVLKFFRNYPDLMKDYDIRDEYELHNLLRKICNEKEYSLIKFKRMPTIEFGYVDRNKQILELLEILAPISNANLAREYENEYGIRHNIILPSLYNDNNEINKIDHPEPPNDLILKIKNVFTLDFYMLDKMKRIYKKEFMNYDEKYFNSYTIKNIGFNVYSNYAIKNNYEIATEYFKKLLTDKDIIDTTDFPNGVKSIQVYYSLLYELKDNYEIIEFAPNKYINIKKLNENGVTIEHLKEYSQVAAEFIDNKYFTLHSLKNLGFKHYLDELGFDDFFYSSILIEDINNFSYVKVGGNKLLYNGKQDIKLSDFLEKIIFSLEELSIDIYELIDYIYNKYRISIDEYKIRAILKNTDMYYNSINEKVYANYDVYYGEL